MISTRSNSLASIPSVLEHAIMLCQLRTREEEEEEEVNIYLALEKRGQGESYIPTRYC